jgi:hypothetical protein
MAATDYFLKLLGFPHWPRLGKTTSYDMDAEGHSKLANWMRARLCRRRYERRGRGASAYSAFPLLNVLGEWERAVTQLNVLGVDRECMILAMIFRRCCSARRISFLPARPGRKVRHQ